LHVAAPGDLAVYAQQGQGASQSAGAYIGTQRGSGNPERKPVKPEENDNLFELLRVRNAIGVI
jgi:hypothetical protein